MQVFRRASYNGRDENVSIQTLIQRQRDPDEPVPLIMTLHKSKESSVNKALENIGKLEAMVEPPYKIRIKSF